MTIEKYDLVSSNTKLNADGWGVPLKTDLSLLACQTLHYVRLMSGFFYTRFILDKANKMLGQFKSNTSLQHCMSFVGQ